jgi:tRNA threonylcarbamoyladenosine biosynthesis protein TsaB
MTTTLAFDTSQQWCCVAVSQHGKVLAHNSTHLPSGHSQLLLPQILNTLTEAQLNLTDIDQIITITGPGSFTGLRVSIATAQGLGLSLTKPVIGIKTFKAFAACIETQKDIMVVIDSQKQDIYCQLFSALQQPLKAPRSINPTHIVDYMGTQPFVLTGTATATVTQVLNDKGINFETLNLTPDQICQNLSLIAYPPEYTSPTTIQPFYLKEAIAGKSM